MQQSQKGEPEKKESEGRTWQVEVTGLRLVTISGAVSMFHFLNSQWVFSQNDLINVLEAFASFTPVTIAQS
jgi:hypothetical protein